MLKGLQWPLWLSEEWYNKDAFVALQTPLRDVQVLWLVCLCISLSVSPRIYLQNCTCNLYKIVGACCRRLWLHLPPAKSAVYHCLVVFVSVIPGHSNYYCNKCNRIIFFAIAIVLVTVVLQCAEGRMLWLESERKVSNVLCCHSKSLHPLSTMPWL